MSAPTVRPSHARYWMLASFCLAAVIAYMQRNAIALPAKQIQSDLNLSGWAMGWLMSGYYWTYALSQLPAGWLGQRYGTLWILPLGMGCSSFCILTMAFAGNGETLAFSWLLAGSLMAGIFPCCVQSFVRWFSPQERAFPSGALSSAMSVGAAISMALSGWLLTELADSEWSGWRVTFGLYAVLGLIWAASFPWWFREHPPAGETYLVESPANNTRNVNQPDWWTDSRTLLIFLQQFLRAAGYVFYSTWFPTYLKATRHVSEWEAGLLASLPLIGVVIGGAVGGWSIDRIDRWSNNRRISWQLVGVLSHLICGLLMFVAAPIENAVLAVSVISLGSLTFALGSACGYAITMDLGGKRVATLFGTMNMCGNIGAALCPVVIGFLEPYIGWHAVLFLFGGLYLAVALCWAFLDPTPRTVES